MAVQGILELSLGGFDLILLCSNLVCLGCDHENYPAIAWVVCMLLQMAVAAYWVSFLFLVMRGNCMFQGKEYVQDN